MRIAYLTLDDVNQQLAENLAGQLGLVIDAQSPRDARPDGQYAAVACDLDYWPGQRRGLLKNLIAVARICPVAVHSYNLEGQEIKRLRRHGILVGRRLDRALLRRLRRRILKTRAAVEERRRVPTDRAHAGADSSY